VESSISTGRQFLITGGAGFIGSAIVRQLLAAEHRLENLICRTHNVGFGIDITIKQLAEIVADMIGYQGKIDFDTSKPDGAARKLMDSGRLNCLGWQPEITLKKGLRSTYWDYLQIPVSNRSK
jgi:GDP-L-fucose synthase